MYQKKKKKKGIFFSFKTNYVIFHFHPDQYRKIIFDLKHSKWNYTVFANKISGTKLKLECELPKIKKLNMFRSTINYIDKPTGLNATSKKLIKIFNDAVPLQENQIFLTHFQSNLPWPLCTLLAGTRKVLLCAACWLNIHPPWRTNKLFCQISWYQIILLDYHKIILANVWLSPEYTLQ